MTNRLHDCETKIRLTERDDELLKQLSWRTDTPAAVLARRFLLQAMYFEASKLGIVNHREHAPRSSAE